MHRPSHTQGPHPATLERSPVVLVGGGGHAQVVACAAQASGRQILGFFDDAPGALVGPRMGLRWLGALQDMGGLSGALQDAAWIVCMGDLASRRRAVELAWGRARLTGAIVVHPRAIIDATARLDAGLFAGPGAIVHSFAHVGTHVIINSGAIIEHDCAIAGNSHVAPGAVLGGGVCVGQDTLIGLGARVLPGIRIGSNCVVGAGAVVTKDVPDSARVAGAPARPL